MQTIPGLYEQFRDSQQGPDCWRSINNYCYPHFHNSLELVYLRRGSMEATLNGKLMTVEAGQLLLVSSYTVHRFHTPNYSDVMVLALPLDYIPSFRRLLGKKTFVQQVLGDGEGTREIYRCMQKLKDCRRRNMESYLVRGYIYIVLGILIKEAEMVDIASQAEHYQIRNILNYLDQNFLSPLRLEDVASHFGYSKSRFSHIFNESVGCGISEYLNYLRSRQAANLLMEDDAASVTDIAMEAGFGSVRSFYRAFQDCFGVTPSRYRELTREERSQLIGRHPVRRQAV